MKDILIQNPIIAAVRDDTALRLALESDTKIVFLLSGNISDLPSRVEQLRAAGRYAFVHMDLIEGLRADQQGIRYLARKVRPCGIISTKPASVRMAQQAGLRGVLRIFMIDSSAFTTGMQGIQSCHPNFVEVMPGLLTDTIRQLNAQVPCPIVAGGMIKNKQQVYAALQSGAIAVSTSLSSLWKG